MHLTPKFKELSFLVYGLGLSGQSVVKFFKKKKIKNFKIWDDREKKLFKNSWTKNLTKSLNEVNYIVLSPGISLKKNKKLIKYKNKTKIEFTKKLSKVVAEYASNNSIEMIIKKDNVLIGKNELDATKIVLDLFDKNIKSIEPN